MSGELLVTEQGPLSAPPILGDRRGMTASELYRVVEPGGSVPQALVDADARVAAQRTAPHRRLRSTFAGARARQREGETFYTAGQQAWFKSAFCANQSQTATLQGCYQGYSFVRAPWNYGEQYGFAFMNGSEGTTGTVTGFDWNGSAQLVYSKALPPGTYVSTSWPVQAPAWHQTALDGVGNSTLVSGAITNCGEGNQVVVHPELRLLRSEKTVACEIVDGNGHGICEVY